MEGVWLKNSPHFLSILQIATDIPAFLFIITRDFLLRALRVSQQFVFEVKLCRSK